MLRAMSTKDTGRRTKRMDRASTLTTTDHATKVALQTTSNTARGMKCGRMELPLLELISSERSMDMGFLNGLTATAMKAISQTISLKATDSTLGVTGASIMASGVTIRWTVLVASLGQMVDDIQATILRTRKTVTVLSSGLTIAFTKAAGKMVNSMAKAFSLWLLASQEERASGRTVKE